MKLCWLVILLGTSSCGVDTPDASKNTPIPPSEEASAPNANAGDSAHNDSNESPPPEFDTATFPLHLDANNLHFFGRVGVSEDFLAKVAQAYDAILADSPIIDPAMRAKYLQATEENHVFQLVGFNGPQTYPGTMNARPGGLYQHNSIDYIWQLDERGPDQIGEVLEHLLHTITAIGMNFAFGDTWNFESNTSALSIAMQEAIDKGYYDVSSYSQLLEDPQAYKMVTATEFVYWLILAEWNYFAIAGKQGHQSTGNEEFTIGSADEIALFLPIGHEFYQTHVAPILSRPDPELIRELFENH